MGDTADPSSRTAALRRAHNWTSQAVQPVYSVQDERPVSQIARRGRGSCSQWPAVLEAAARASGVPTRVPGLPAIDRDGTTLCPATGPTHDLSAHVLAVQGHFDSRGELFARHGRTPCRMARLIAEPVQGHRAVG